MADLLVAGSFDPVGVVAGPLDDLWVAAVSSRLGVLVGALLVAGVVLTWSGIVAGIH